MKINKTSPDESKYLKIISSIAQKPKRLWFVGNLPEKRWPTVAIVGTRKPTSYGREMAHRLSYELATRGVVIVSGLALGIDGIAHRAALEAGGITIAVMAGGLDAIHPRTHRSLAVDIITNGGALISEYGAGEPAYKQNFIARNRIVSGISDVVVVIEASKRSGTIHTASFALEQGRTVMAVPGNITSPASAGCNTLIKTGAAPVTEVADILQELGLAEQPTSVPLGDSPEEQIILRLLTDGLRDGDTIQKQSGLAPALFGQTLTMLEIRGKIRALGANQWTIGQ
ncbi:MAG TPA: DNA-processing protein DprA [Candidatus Saccharimonadales bacterium]|nr:DNA-processing protein DprA [Candidatus Saccharimonadales bacterium]